MWSSEKYIIWHCQKSKYDVHSEICYHPHLVPPYKSVHQKRYASKMRRELRMYHEYQIELCEKRFYDKMLSSFNTGGFLCHDACFGIIDGYGIFIKQMDPDKFDHTFPEYIRPFTRLSKHERQKMNTSKDGIFPYVTYHYSFEENVTCVCCNKPILLFRNRLYKGAVRFVIDGQVGYKTNEQAKEFVKAKFQEGILDIARSAISNRGSDFMNEILEPYYENSYPFKIKPSSIPSLEKRSASVKTWRAYHSNEFVGF